MQYSLASLLVMSFLWLTLSTVHAAATGFPDAPIDFPPNPLRDVPWEEGFDSVADIEAAFNAARQIEAQDLNIDLPDIDLPSQTEWDAYSDGEKVLWLMNQERIDRGLLPFHGVESNITGVAQYYADYLLEHDATGHTADGNDPHGRVTGNAAIGACFDFLPQVENLAYFWSTHPIPMSLERSVYGWLYDDSDSAWGHRTAILQFPFNDNSGTAGREGFIGIGHSSGPMSYAGEDWPYAEVVVLNLFDPCASWVYEGNQEPILSLSATSLSFTAVTNGANPAEKEINITNSGGGTLLWQASTNVPWITLSASSGTAPATLRIGVNTAALAEGDYEGVVRIQSGAQSQDITITLKVKSFASQATVYVPALMYPTPRRAPVYFADNFCQSSSGFPVGVVTDSYTLGYLTANCQYRIQITADDTLVLASPGISATNYRAEAEFHFESTIGSAGLAIALDEEWNEFYIFGITSDGIYGLTYFAGDEWHDVVPPTPSPISVLPNPVHLQLDRQGSEFVLYLGSTRLKTVNDGRNHAGSVGIYAEGAAGFEARFHSFKVSGQ